MGLLTQLIDHEFQRKRQERVAQMEGFKAALANPETPPEVKQEIWTQMEKGNKAAKPVLDLLRPHILSAGKKADSSTPAKEDASERPTSSAPRMFQSREELEQHALDFQKREAEQKNQSELEFAAKKQAQDMRFKQLGEELHRQDTFKAIHETLVNPDMEEGEKQIRIGILGGASSMGAGKIGVLVSPDGKTTKDVFILGPGQYRDVTGKPVAAPDGWSPKTREEYDREQAAKKPAKPTGELAERLQAQEIVDHPEQHDDTEVKAARATLKHLDTIQKGAQVRIDVSGQQLQPGGGTAPTQAGQPDADGRFPETISKMPAGQQSIVKQLVDYKYPLPSSFALRSPYWQKILETASQYDPSFNAAQYNNRVALMKDFTSGKAANNIRSLNTAVGHLDTLQKAATALDNGGIQLWNAIANKGLTATGDPRVTNFNVAANAVESELAAVFKGMGATDQEIKAWRENLSAAESPEQLRGAISTAVELLGSRLDALRQQYESGMGRKPHVQFLTPKSESILSKITSGGEHAAQSWEATATGKDGHKIGYRGGKWYDVQSGAEVK